MRTCPLARPSALSRWEGVCGHSLASGDSDPGSLQTPATNAGRDYNTSATKVCFVLGAYTFPRGYFAVGVHAGQVRSC